MSLPASPAATPPRFAFFAAISAVHDPAALRGLVESFAAPLRALGGVDWDAAGPPPAPLAVLVVTGGTERSILDRLPPDAHEPVLLVAHPGHNSLPAALEVLGCVQQHGRRGRVHYLRGPDDSDGWSRLDAALHDLAVRRALLASRIGLVGPPSDWLVASSPAPGTVREVWGPTVVPLALEVLMTEGDARAAAAGEAVAEDFRAGASAVVEPGAADLAAAGRVYADLCALVEGQRLDAVAVRCFDLVTRRRTTGCLALARLNEQGVVAGCEGDLVATVAMLWLDRLLGSIPWMANPARVDLERGVLGLAHCTVARGLGGPYRLRSHFESGLGVGIQGTLPAGPVTLARIGGSRMERLTVFEGDLLGNTDHADLCRTQVEVEVGRKALQDLLARPLGNHLVLAPGHHGAALRRWHEAMIA